MSVFSELPSISRKVTPVHAVISTAIVILLALLVWIQLCFFDFHFFWHESIHKDIARYGNTGVKSPLCGRKATITNTDNGKSVTITMADACPTCGGSNDWDLSVAAFKAIADEATGIVPSKSF